MCPRLRQPPLPFTLKEDQLSYALESIDASIKNYQEYLKKWKVEGIKKALAKAKRLRTKITDAR